MSGKRRILKMINDLLPLPEDRFIKLSLDDIKNMITFLLSIQQNFKGDEYIFEMTESMIDLFLDQLSAEDRNLMIGE